MANIEKIKNGNTNIFLLDKKYIIKSAKKEILQAEKIFIEKYSELKVEKIIENNIEKNYNIYEYIDGTIINKLGDVDNCLNEIYNIIQKYVEVEVDGYGDILFLKYSWEDFLKQEIDKKSKYIKVDSLNMKNRVFNEIEKIGKIKTEKKLLHGDLGSFNIICKNKKIEGIIDPRTIVGDPLYDFIYFIFSNHNFMNEMDFSSIFNILNNQDIEKIFAYMYILLYDRISIEEKNNTGAQGDFYNAWIIIQEIQNRMINSK